MQEANTNEKLVVGDLITITHPAQRTSRSEHSMLIRNAPWHRHYDNPNERHYVSVEEGDLGVVIDVADISRQTLQDVCLLMAKGPVGWVLSTYCRKF